MYYPNYQPQFERNMYDGNAYDRNRYQYGQSQMPQGGQQMQNQMMNQPQPQMQTAQNTVQPNYGFVSVQSEDEARKWPVAPGNSMMFRDENAPFVYTKTMGFSQLDRPIFDKYKLVRMEDPVPPVETQTDTRSSGTKYAKLDDVLSMRADISDIKEQLERLKEDLADE